MQKNALPGLDRNLAFCYNHLTDFSRKNVQVFGGTILY